MRAARHAATAAALLALVIASAGCSGGGNAAGRAAGESADKPAQGQPVAPAAGAPSPAGSAPAGEPSTAAASAPAAGKDIDPAKVPDLLVANADLPSGWKTGSAVLTDDTGTANPEKCQAVADLLQGRSAAVEPVAAVRTGLQDGSAKGSLRAIGIRAYTDDGAAKLMADAAAARPGCATFRAVDSQGEEAEYHLAPGIPPKLGDEGFASLVTTKAGSKSYTLPATFIRVGNVIVSFMAYEGSFPDDVMRAQVAKVVAARKA
ncbi:hypothetical protein GCM10023205_55120 [Yinghuangia aomiensis]|uniref:PknH-like extracellular domain-containing protein n=1 Tax=Yinghuangia aomiensis TaxID=676205 RepID=A0ABP9HV18_9ACTN